MTNPNRTTDRSWHPAPTLGVTYAILRNHGDGEGTTLITRFAAGTRAVIIIRVAKSCSFSKESAR
jgi:hypothetical protein